MIYSCGFDSLLPANQAENSIVYSSNVNMGSSGSVLWLQETLGE